MLVSGSSDGYSRNVLQAFRHGLQELGFAGAYVLSFAAKMVWLGPGP
jgi:hypothetical protein